MAVQDCSASQWALDLLLSTWEAWDGLWCERNSVVHGDSPQSRRVIFQDRVLRDLRRTHNQQHLHLPRDCKYLLSSYDTHSTQDIHSIANWVHAHNPVFQASIEQAQRTAVTNVAPITDCVQVSPSQPVQHRSHPSQQRHRLGKLFMDNRRFITQKIQTFLTLPFSSSASRRPRHSHSTDHNMPSQFFSDAPPTSTTNNTTSMKRFSTQPTLTHYFIPMFWKKHGFCHMKCFLRSKFWALFSSFFPSSQEKWG